MTETTDRDVIAVHRAAQRLRDAAADRAACPPVRDLIGPADLHTAYRVQEQLTAWRLADGARITGRKIGLTSEAVQHQLGVDQPDFGVLFDDMAYAEGDTIPMDGLLQPRAEAEIAFVLGADLADGPLDDAQIRSAVGYAVAALEICDSRVAGWDISFGDTVADNASAGLYVLGSQRQTLAEVEPSSVAMTMRINGTEVSTGTGIACLGDPLAALAWLAHSARDFGEPLRAGQVILSGALGPMKPVQAGDEVSVDITGFSTVTARFGKEIAL